MREYDPTYDYQADPIAILYIRSNLRLVTDLQTCVKAQQSQAYAHKVKLTNLKQMAETDKIMIDLAGYYKKINKNGRDTLNWRDHGMLFKMWPQDLPLLFGEPEIYYLDEM